MTPAGIQGLPATPKMTDVAEFLVSRGAGTVLDLGCAIGRWSVFLASVGMPVTGLDLSSDAIGMAKNWAADLGFDDSALKFVAGDVLNLPFCDAGTGGPCGAAGAGDIEEEGRLPGSSGFDAVVASSILDFMPLESAKKAMREIRRVLKKGGSLFLSVAAESPSDGEKTVLGDGTLVFLDGTYEDIMWRHYSDDELTALLSDSDFEILHFETVASGDRWVFAAKR